MERSVARCTFIFAFVVYGLIQEIEGGKPIMYPEMSEITINEGDELKIQCHSRSKVKFTTLSSIGNVEQSKIKFLFDENLNTYTLIRPRTVRGDTGWYACSEESVKIRNDEQTIEHPDDEISWIYVYVKSSEPFAVDGNFEFITVMTGSRAVIPCRTTSPDLEVELMMNNDLVEEDKVERYDSKIGFVLPEVHFSQNEEQYTCKIKTPDGDYDQLSSAFYILKVIDSGRLPKPIINLERLRHVVWGEDLTLECSITVSVGVSVILNLTAPSHVPAYRWRDNQRLLLKKNTEGKMVHTVLMIVKDLEKDDYGVYTCTARGATPDATNESSETFKIWDPSLIYVNATIDSANTSLTLSKGETATWRILVDAYPTDVDFQWISPQGVGITDIRTDPRNKYSYNNNTGNTHIFRISQLGIDDNGIYTINFFNRYKNHTVNLPLTVTVPPVSTISKTLTTYFRGQLAVFYCHTTGSPLPNVSWSYIEYPDFPSKENYVEKNFESTKETKSSLNVFSLESIFRTHINVSGDLICKACNSNNCTETTESISVYDEDFGIDGPKEVTEGDDFNLTCFASRRNFTDNIAWTFEDESVPEDIRIIDGTSETKFRIVLEMRDVRKSHAGKYSCQAQYKETGFKISHHNVIVMSAEEPRIVETNMNDTKMTVKINRNNRDQKLTCHVEGRPTPEITWYKENNPIENNDQYYLSSGNFILRIKLYNYEDSGKYTCKAKNRLGEVERYVNLVVDGEVKPPNNAIWISLICVLIVIIIIVIMIITCMFIKVRKEKRLRKELLASGLTHFREGLPESLNPDLTVDEQAELLPYDTKWEFPRENLKLGKQLGSGAFGVVMKAQARGICVEGEVTTVAVKMVRRSADPSYMKALSSELKIMIHLGRHLNVVNLLGACTKTIVTKRELYVIVEYCRFGNLHNYLQRQRESFIDQIDPATQKIDIRIGLDILNERTSIGNQDKAKYSAVPFSPTPSTKSSSSNSDIQLLDYRVGPNFEDINMSPDGGVLSNNSVQPGWRSNYRGDYKDQNLKPICTQDLLCWAWQVARGMEYLSARKVLHGDLAARNILLADDNIVKICDFGLAKNMYKDNNYTKKGEGPLPIKWMAIESIRDRMFSTQSDVWSYGIVLWEFFTLARTPYPGMEAEKQYDKLIEGYRMEKPEYATDEIYDFMLHCWKAKPSLRPTFPELAERIGTLLNESIKMHYVDLNTPYIDMNTAAFENGKNDYLAMMSSPNHDYHNAPEPMLQARRPDSAYLSMSPLNKSMEPGIFSPRSELEESHFSFPSPSANSPITSDTEDCVEAVPMLINDDPYLKPIDVKQRRAEFVKQSKAEAPIERDSGYCNVSSNPHFAKANDQSSDPINNLDKNSNPNEQNENNVKYTSPIIHGQDNYVNMPQQKNNRAKDAVLDSFSNPSYVIMSKLEDDRQFV